MNFSVNYFDFFFFVFPLSSYQSHIFQHFCVVKYFNVIGSGPRGRLGDAPSRELKEQGRISGACLDAALAIIPESKVITKYFLWLIH